MQHDDIYWPYDYAYNANGHLAVNTWHGVTIDYAPNGRGQPTKAGTYATGVTYHPNGAMAQFTYGNGVLHTMMQNERGLPEYSKDAYGTKEYVDNRYDYDAAGNVVTIADGRIDSPNARAMTYDDANRLKTATSPRFGTASYSYDVLDNIAQLSIGGANARNHFYCYDAATWRLTNLKTTSCATGATVTGFGYDAQGNVNNKDGTLYNFDAANRLRTVTYAGNPVATYAYDGHGRRIWNSTPAGEGNSQYSQDGRLVLGNNLRKMTISDYIQLNGSLLATRERDAITNIHTYKYHHTDALGTPVSVTDQNRAELERHDYEPYGKVVGSAIVDEPGYTGHIEDAATSLIYMQQRYYDAGAGRFLSVDPIATRPAGDNFNRYWYANNNPYRFNDPDGRDALWVQHKDGTSTLVIKVLGTGSGANMAAVEQRVEALALPGENTKIDMQVVTARGKGVNTLNMSPGLDSGMCGAAGECTNRRGGDRAHVNSDENTAVDAAAHEVLHFAGLGDQYKEGPRDANGNRTSVPTDGYDNTNIMSSRAGTTLNQTQLDEAKSNKSTTKVDEK